MAILAIDEGTTNSKAIVVDQSGRIVTSASCPVQTEHPRSGWVQQDAEDIWEATLNAIGRCLDNLPSICIDAIGISNQRESILIWDRNSGKPLGPVITWQCRRTSDACASLRAAGYENDVIARTGLPLDPMFPPTKAAWLIENHGGDANFCIGTVDSWLIWKLTGGHVHATDKSNAARTQLFNIVDGDWDHDLCKLFNINANALPNVQDSSHHFGTTKGVALLKDGIPIAAAIGDSHAALFGHGAHSPGDGKVTFGTGSSVMTTIQNFMRPPKGITTTIAWSLNGTPTFALEGNILVSASILPWTASLLSCRGVDELLDLAATVADSNGVSLVPAHVGLGSPHWNAEARGLISGLSFGSEPAHIARAAAESIALQVGDVFAIMTEAAGQFGRLSIDGGPSSNPFLMQMVADYLDQPVVPCKDKETSALGAAYLAGLAINFWNDLDAVRHLPNHSAPILPSMKTNVRRKRLDEWLKAVARTVKSV